MSLRIIKILKYILAILGFFRLANYFKNISGNPFFYDIFLSHNNTKVCLIAPYYMLSSFKKVSCSLIYDDEVIKVKADILEDPDRDIIVVSFLIYKEVMGNSSIDIRLQKDDKVFFEKSLEKISGIKKYQLSITTLFKYEIPFLKEWIEFYLKQGVEHFYLYDNNNTDDRRGVDELKPYIEKGLVTYISWPYPYVLYNSKIKFCWPNDSYSFTQSAQINHAIYKYGNETECLLYCDLDEYVYSMNKKNLVENINIIKSGQDVSSLNIPGKWFGGKGSDIDNLGKFGVVKTFSYSEEGFTSPPKCIFFPKNIILASIHRVSLKSDGEDINVSPDIIRFNHYRAMGWKKRLDPNFATAVINKDIFSI